MAVLRKTPFIPALALTLFVLLITAPSASRAQGIDFGGDGPIEVEAEQGIEWRRDERVVVARGNARAIRGGDSIAADVLTAYYREVDGRQEIHRLEADGNVEIASDSTRMYGSHAVYEADSDTVVLTGAPARIVTPEETVAAEEGIELRNGENVAVARGDVQIERGDQRLRADVVTAHFVESESGKAEVRELEAEGNVLLSTPKEIVRARHATYDVRTELATLTGSVKITQGKNQLNGDVADVNLATGVSRLRAAGGAAGGGRVRALLFPEGSGNARNGER